MIIATNPGLHTARRRRPNAPVVRRLGNAARMDDGSDTGGGGGSSYIGADTASASSTTVASAASAAAIGTPTGNANGSIVLNAGQTQCPTGWAPGAGAGGALICIPPASAVSSSAGASAGVTGAATQLLDTLKGYASKVPLWGWAAIALGAYFVFSDSGPSNAGYVSFPRRRRNPRRSRRRRSRKGAR